MKKLCSCLILFIGLISFPFTKINAQNLLGYANSNYSGTNGLILNPSSIADARQVVYLNLTGENVTFRNDYLTYTSSTPIKQYLLSGDPNWKNYFTENRGGGKHNIDFTNDTRGPSIMVSFDQKNSVALSTRLRSSIQAYDIPEKLITTIEDGYDVARANLYEGLQTDGFKLNTNMYSEFAVSYARVVYDDRKNFVKVGASIKRERGLFIFNYHNRLLDFKIAKNDSIVGYQSDGTVTYTSEKYFGFDSLNAAKSFNPKQTIKKWFFGKDKVGGGWGFDIGGEYEWRPHRKYFYTMDNAKHKNPEVNKYKLKLGFAINDIGHITYNNPNVKTFDMKNSLGDTVFVTHTDTIKVKSSDDIIRAIDHTFGGVTAVSTIYKSKLPTVLVLQADYLVRKNIYVNATLVQSLRKTKEYDGTRLGTMFAITPRFEHRWVELAIPIIYKPQFNSLEYGICGRLAFLYFGVNNPLSFKGIGNISGADIYFGVCLDFAKHMMPDRDKDRVSNRMDKCVSDPGPWAAEGCPDRDKDSIADNIDKCPDVAGEKQFQGCPDRDKDGVMDSLDKCPDVFGLKKLEGCPDKDKDGVADKDDHCPDKFGDKKTNGCPDTDKDGLADDVDHCPDKAGTKELFGCPDKDKDGVADDSDRCPDKIGSKELLGCPDKDKDGIADRDDKCPNQKGTKENNGCPEKKIPEAEQALLSTAFDNLLFENNKSVIKESSFESLDSLAELMNKRTKYRLVLAGYTDNVGSETSNKTLSSNRANAVKEYIVSKGVSEERISAIGYGSANPIAENTTDEGRKKNRRVEFEILKEK